MTIKQADIDRISSKLLLLANSNRFDLPAGTRDDLAEASDLIDALKSALDLSIRAAAEAAQSSVSLRELCEADANNCLFRTTDMEGSCCRGTDGFPPSDID